MHSGFAQGCLRVRLLGLTRGLPLRVKVVLVKVVCMVIARALCEKKFPLRWCLRAGRSRQVEVSKFLVGFEPVVAGADFDFDGAGQFEGADHALGDEFAQGGLLFGVEVEHEFVVDLEEHAASELIVGD